ncbi:MAG: hypothetical protein V1861_06535 [Candidatus Micrarchaeota archaeon]
MAERQLKVSETLASPDRIAANITASLTGHPNLVSSSLMITPELYRQLQDPQAQAALLERLGRANPGFRFSITRLIPTEEHGDLGVPGVVIGIERFSKSSVDEVCRDVTPALRAHPNLASTSLVVTPELYRQLQDPQTQAAMLERLGQENPGYRFSITRFIPTFEHGDLGLPGIVISISPTAQRTAEQERLGQMYRAPTDDTRARVERMYRPEQ